ncbi:adenylyl-sulfate kinase [Paenibacillus hexagrammi]|uniref:Adenylyl-sulfate kinase n=1 Tax=Paenibacillus hexagrammi TaxID=2908839 RepID=A0ABY3SJT3_9BACL|nr:adenylyl-sulfate kinase [Paenibacillus sp. YPD9-1]UJF34283.1 adenylyl-sulfate kinase [Paenibacillus sp. YPD9-1]
MNPSHKSITWHHPSVSKLERYQLNGHNSCTLWFTGLSGSGKSTLAFSLEKELLTRGIRSYVLDGDNIRHGLNSDLSFSEQDRRENIRRIGEVSKLFVDAGLFVLSAFISPHTQDREMVRSLFQPGEFLEVYVKCSLEECEYRDPKGLYKKARRGDIHHFTGISARYEVPVQPDILIDTETSGVQESVQFIIKQLEERNIL